MAYTLLVNSQTLAQAVLSADVALATALSAALATLLLGLWANYLFALAPGVGLNAYSTFRVVLVGIVAVTAAGLAASPDPQARLLRDLPLRAP